MALETLHPTTHWGGGGNNYVDEGWLESCKPPIQLYETTGLLNKPPGVSYTPRGTL